MSDRFTEVFELARAVRRAAERDLTARVWTPSSAERRIAIDVARAMKLPAIRNGPPYVSLPLGERLLRLAPWAATIRLAMAAGGWQLADDDAAPPAGGPVDLPALLSALYGPARVIERWADRVHNLGLAGLGADQAEAKLLDEVPELQAHLAEAERFFDGLASVAVTLYVIWSGDVDV